MTAPSQSSPEQPAPDELRLTQPAADQFAYHVRMSAVFAVAGQTEESASEAVLAWAMLRSLWPESEARAAEIGAELIDQSVASISDRARAAATSRARGLTLDVEAHFVTVGRQDEASIYAAVADQLDDTVGSLVPER